MVIVLAMEGADGVRGFPFLHTDMIRRTLNQAARAAMEWSSDEVPETLSPSFRAQRYRRLQSFISASEVDYHDDHDGSAPAHDTFLPSGSPHKRGGCSVCFPSVPLKYIAMGRRLMRGIQRQRWGPYRSYLCAQVPPTSLSWLNTRHQR